MDEEPHDSRLRAGTTENSRRSNAVKKRSGVSSRWTTLDLPGPACQSVQHPLDPYRKGHSLDSSTSAVYRDGSIVYEGIDGGEPVVIRSHPGRFSTGSRMESRREGSEWSDQCSYFSSDSERTSIVSLEATEDGQNSDYFSVLEDTDDEEDYENPTRIVMELQERENKREHVVREFLHVEETYVDKLSFLKMARHHLETFNSVRNMFSAEEPGKMFPCVDELHELHANCIVPELKSILLRWSTESCLSKVFEPHLPRLAIYKEYIRSHQRAVVTIKTWKKNEIDFSNLMCIFQQHSNLNLFDITDVMFEPCCRLPRWRLLIQRYKKYLAESSDEFNRISEVLHYVDTIMEECENHQKVAQDLSTLVDLERRIDGVLTYFRADTELLKEGPVKEVDPRSKQFGGKAFNKIETQLYFFLFNRFLLICSQLKQEHSKMTICGKIDLKSMRLLKSDMMSCLGYDPSQCLVLQTTRKVLQLLFRSVEEANSWSECIRKACKKETGRRSFKENQTSCWNFTCAPLWIPDNYIDSCMTCSQKFSVIRWRHHCRGCGIIICASCSNRKIRLPYSNLEKGIVCANCYKRALKINPNLTDRNSDEFETVEEEEVTEQTCVKFDESLRMKSDEA